ncbi:MAG TPA: hypothetical protein VIA98_11290 [Allosphingosinicella sp.]|jgi:hypothetical protein
MTKEQDLRLPHDVLSRTLSDKEIEEVSGAEFYEASVVQPNTSSMTTGCGSQSKSDSDYD